MDAHDLPLFSRPEPDAVTYTAPCGQDFDTPADMGSHAALCDQCAGAVEARAAETRISEEEAELGRRPYRATKTARVRETREAIDLLQTYAAKASHDGDASQTRLLLWAIARIERTLNMQTFGRFGNIHSHATHVQTLLRNEPKS